jgi:predicted DNA-binding mobile mystery protein A
MKAIQKRLITEQLEKSLERMSCMRSVQRPPKGWLRAIREALGMPGKHFARRLGVSPPRINRLEKNEINDSATLKTMRQAAEALDCVFVYGIIPKESLTSSIRKRAESLAGKRLSRVSHSMLLEHQQLSEDEQRQVFEREVEELIRSMPKELWEDHREF